MEPDSKKAKMSGKYKQQNKKYFQQKKQQELLQVGQRGFFATCNTNEKACVRECYNLLNHYADVLYGPEKATEEKTSPIKDEAANTVIGNGDDDDDLEVAAAKCRETLKHRKVRFQNVGTKTNNCVFIRTLLDDPVTLGKHIVDDIASTGVSMSRFVLRLVPIETVCRANMLDIINAAGILFDKHFLKEPTSYGIIFNHRYNQQIKRDEVINQLAELVKSKNLNNKVDLQHAKKSIIVEVLRGWCLLSVIDNYVDFKKYNLAELAGKTAASNDGPKPKSNDDPETKSNDNPETKSNDDSETKSKNPSDEEESS